ncbi:hypothetical protein ACU5AX_13545 [Sphingomonas sp. XXL09]|uniref:hypothetical protein n=1 Tax=Sphingomonas sp. XXL09 TaxID=3457787 RepID=UPI00406BB821
MKLILLAATALIAAPVMAQQAGTMAPQTATPAPTDQTTPPPPADQTATPPATDTMAPTQQAGTPAPMTTGSGTPAGGYQPSGSALSGPATPGAPVTFRPAPTPDQAYPAPAPKAEYPVCKAGQYDGCRQVEGRKMTKAKRRTRR